MDTVFSEEKCKWKNGKTTLPAAFSAKSENEGDGDGCCESTKVAVAVARK